LKLTVFDLDHTLLSGDSDVLWCEFLMGHGVLDRASFAPRNRLMESQYKAGTVSPLDFSQFYLSTLAGRSPAFWQPWRQRFLDEVIAPRIPASARSLLREHQTADELVVMSTATNRFITELTAAHLHIEHLIATECELSADGCFNGAIAGIANMRQGKVDRLHAWLAARGQTLAEFESRFYSDSINDLPLLLAVQHAVAVDPDARLRAEALARGWPMVSLR
jgi:HAD superfamily hydrolase (TIGR01490 family)